MPFNGSGVFQRVRNWVADATAGIKIRADFHDIEDDGFAAGLSNCITKDGQTIVTQNIPFNSKRITGLEDPVNPQDAATKAYADTKASLTDDSTFTGDITIENDDPSLTLDGKDGFKNSIYGDKGGKHRWEIVLGNATTEGGSDVGSDFELVNYHDDGTLIGDVFFGRRSTGLMTVKGDPVEPLGIVTKQYADVNVFPTEDRFTTSGSFSWTVPPNTTVCDVHVYGGGGGGGTGHSGFVGGGGGGAAGYAHKKYTGLVPGTVISLVVGAGGAGGPGGAGATNGGSSGGSSSFAGTGGTVSATGGSGGNAGINPIPGVPQSSGVGSGGDTNLQGGYGSAGASGTNANGSYTGYGGLGGMCAGPEGGKGGAMSTGSGSPGIGFGAGGSGGGSAAGINTTGGNGGNGAVLVKW